MATLTARESGQVEAANASGRTPVVFIHGLWLLASSWDRWAALFEQAGFAPVAPGWPDDPETVEEARAHPEAFAGKKVGQVADHVGDVAASGAPLFQAASANLNPWTEAKVNSKNPERGPLLLISGETDHTVPWAIVNASYKKQR